MTRKEELKQKILEALSQRIGKNDNLPFPALDEKRKKVINLIYKKLVADGKVTEKSINEKIDDALKMMKDQTKMNDVNVFAGIKEAFAEVSEKQTKAIIKSQKEKPTWHKDFPEFPSEITVKKNEKERKSDIDLLTSLLGTFFTSLVDFFTKLSKGVFKVRLNTEHYLTPQKVVLIDPRTMKAFNLKDLQSNSQVVVSEAGGYLRVLKLKNKEGQEINPASEEGLAELKSVLEEIRTNTSDIEVSIGDVDVNTDALEAKTDEVISIIKDYTVRLIESAPYTYIGKAEIGSAEGSAVWQIKRIDETSGMKILYADGNINFDNIWSNYASLSYS